MRRWMGWIIGLSFLSIVLLGGYLFAQDEEMTIAHEEVFQKLERAPVVFTHQKHVDVLGGDESCAECHHVYSEEEGKESMKRVKKQVVRTVMDLKMKKCLMGQPNLL